jgi:membrane associated rhomboid family serine protease
MFLPIGDEPNDPTRRAYVNYALIAANVLAFLLAKATAGGTAYAAFTMEWGFTPVAPRIETFFTSMFMHGDFMHLAGNMLFLWIFGDNVEAALGHAGYLFAYVACGLAAVLFFRVLGPDSTIPLVGASGAIFGIEGFYFVAFRRNRVKVFYWLYVMVGTAMIPAMLFLGIAFVENLLYMLMFGKKIGGGVAFAAHVGGFVVGALIALPLRLRAD